MANEIQKVVEEQNDVISLQKRQLNALIEGGFIPKGCSKEEAFARVVAGASMGMKPIQAINGIAMINGKPTLHSDSIPCTVMASGLVNGMKYKFTGEGETLACTFYVRRKGIEEYQEWTYSMEDAKKAGLLSNPVWQKHPKKMLFNRARTWCFRNTFPDVIGNVYTQEEIEDVEYEEVKKDQKPIHDDSNAQEEYKALPLSEPQAQEEPAPEQNVQSRVDITDPEMVDKILTEEPF